MRGLRHRLTAGAGVLATVVALLATAASPATATPQPGAPGVGDVLFPNLGNGGYDARHYDLNLRYDTPAPVQTVHGRVKMDAVATQSLSRFDLDFGDDSVDSVDSVESVTVNGHAAKFVWQQSEEELVITPATPICQGRAFSVEVAFTSGPRAPAPDDLFPVVWIATPDGSFTSFQPNTAHNAIPTNDHPSDKATWRFTLDVPTGVTAVTNGVKTGERSANGRTVWSYEQRSPMATELMQIAVGTDLTVVGRDPVSGVQYRDVIAQGPQHFLEPAFAKGPAQLQWVIDKVGSFPHEIYGNLGVNLRFGYALETQGLSLHSEGLFNPDFIPDKTGQEWFYSAVMVHEETHEWFGDSVSPLAWSDVWMNEGWATYLMTLWEQETDTLKDWGFPSFEEYMKQTYRQGDIWRAAYGPVARPSSAETLFSENVYDGAAVVLYALKQKVGDTTFTRIMKGWPSQNKDKSRSTEDFIAFASRTSGKDLRGFLRDWLYGTTTPKMPGHEEWTVDPVTPEATAKATAKVAGHTHGTKHSWGLAG